MSLLCAPTMSSSANNQAFSLQPAPTLVNRAGASSQVLVTGHQLQVLVPGHASPLPLEAPHFEAATSSGITLPNAFGESVAVFEHCCKRKSRSHDPKSRQGLTKCSAPGCDKCLHYSCYQAVLDQCGVKSVIFPASSIPGQPSGEAVCCSKSCHKKLVKIMETTINAKTSAGENERFLWDNDGKDGENDSDTSMSILLNWMTTGDNYTKYRGSKHGLKKTFFADQLAKRMNDAGCAKGTRNAKQVVDKIAMLEQSFRKAYDWAEGQTGSGLKESDEGSFNDYCKKLCKNYFDLLPIMQDRANAKPMMTSDDIANDFDTLSASSIELDDEDSIGSVAADATGSNSVNDNIDGSSSEQSSNNNANTSASGVTTEKNISASNKKTKTKKKSMSRRSTNGKKTDLGIDSSVARLQEMKRTEIAAQKEMKSREIYELKRHHLVMEEVETKRQEVETKRQKSDEEVTKWKSKQEQLTYMSSLEAKFEVLKAKGWNDKRILRVYPDLSPFLDDKSTDEDE